MTSPAVSSVRDGGATHAGVALTSKSAVFAAILCGVSVSMSLGKLPIVLPLLRDEFGLSLAGAGWLVAMFNTVAMCTGLVVGAVAGRIGALYLCVASMTLGLAAGTLALLVDSVPVLLASRVVEGLAFIAVTASAPALVSVASAPTQRRFAMALWSTHLPIGACLCLVVAPAVLAHAGWRAFWLVVLAVGVAATVGVALQRDAYAAARETSADVLGDVRGLLREAPAWWLSLALACFALQFFAIVTWMPTWLRDERGFGDATIAALTTGVIAVNVPGNLLGGMLLQRGANRGALIAGAFLICSLCSLGVYGEMLRDHERYALCIVLNLVGGIVPAAVVSSSTVLARRPTQIGALQGLYMQASNVGQFVGALAVASAVSSHGGAWSAALWATLPAGGLGVIAGCAVLGMRH